MSSPLNVIPEAVEAAAHDLANIGTSISEATSMAAPLTTAIAPAAADEISAGIAALFGGHGEWFQQLAAQAQALHQQFVQTLAGAGSAYQEMESANTQMTGMHRVGLGENLLSIQTGQGAPGNTSVGVSSSIPLDLLLGLTNTGYPILTLLDNAALGALGYPF